MAGLLPPLLSSLPGPTRVQLTLIPPALFGTVCGFLLGETETGWWIGQAIAIAGGFLGGLEHLSPGAGALRGLIAGTTFGLGILVGDAINGAAPAAEVPDPLGLLVIITALGGVILHAAGASLRARAER